MPDILFDEAKFVWHKFQTADVGWKKLHLKEWEALCNKLEAYPDSIRAKLGLYDWEVINEHIDDYSIISKLLGE